MTRREAFLGSDAGSPLDAQVRPTPLMNEASHDSQATLIPFAPPVDGSPCGSVEGPQSLRRLAAAQLEIADGVRTVVCPVLCSNE